MTGSVQLTICVGAACHQAGAYYVLETLRRLLREHGLDGQIALRGAFCMERCTDGVILEFEGRRFFNVRPETVETLFFEQILPRLAERNADG